MSFKWKKFQKSWTFIIIIFSISLLLISFSFADEAFIASKNIKTVFRIIGQTILSSTVFLGVVKTLQYTDYFKEEINEVVYTDRYLKELSLDTLRQKWILLTNVLHSTKFPSLKNNLNEHVLNSIISTEKNYTHSRMRISYIIKPEGGGKKFFKLIEKIDMKTNSEKDQGIEFCIRANLIKENTDSDISSVKFTSLIIDDKEVTNELPQFKEILTSSGEKQYSLTYKHPAIQKSVISIFKELETIHSARLNAYWQTDFDTFVEDGLEITLHYDPEIFEVDILALGQTISLKKDTFESYSSGSVKYVCPNLIFQKDCLILIIKYK